MKYFTTSWEKEKAYLKQEEATARYYKLGFWFIVVYFGGHLVVALARYLISII